MTNRDLAGKIWVANFIYTTCPGPCLDLTRNLSGLQSEISGNENERLVSFTVDPAMDTPTVLSAYAEAHGADPKRWLFVTGDKTALYDLFEKGFHIAALENTGPDAATDGKFIHTTKMVLVDRKGIIRGYYDGLIPQSRKKLASDMAKLERE